MMPVKLYQRSKLKQTASALNGSPSVNVDTLTQAERPLQAVGAGLPRLGQRRHDLGAALLRLDQALEDLVDHPRALSVADERAVNDDRVLSDAEDQRPPAARAFLVAAAVVVAGAGSQHKSCCGQARDEGEPARQVRASHLFHLTVEYRPTHPGQGDVTLTSRSVDQVTPPSWAHRDWQRLVDLARPRWNVT